LRVVEQRKATNRNSPHPSVPLEARMTAPITQAIETALEMSSKNVLFISVLPPIKVFSKEVKSKTLFVVIQFYTKKRTGKKRKIDMKSTRRII
jgi:hypothetical protein